MKKSLRMIIRNMDIEEDSLVEHVENKLFNNGNVKDRKINHVKLQQLPKHKVIVRSSCAKPSSYMEED